MINIAAINVLQSGLVQKLERATVYLFLYINSFINFRLATLGQSSIYCRVVSPQRI